MMLLPTAAFLLRAVRVRDALASFGRRVDKPNTETLVLLANGIPFRARDAFSTSRREVRETTFDHRPVVSTAVAAAFAVLGVRLAGSIDLDELQQASLRDAHHTETTRLVEIPEQVALAAVAAHKAGIPVDGTDVLSQSETRRDERVQAADTRIERGELLSALLLR